MLNSYIRRIIDFLPKRTTMPFVSLLHFQFIKKFGGYQEKWLEFEIYYSSHGRLNKKQYCLYRFRIGISYPLWWHLTFNYANQIETQRVERTQNTNQNSYQEYNSRKNGAKKCSKWRNETERNDFELCVKMHPVNWNLLISISIFVYTNDAIYLFAISRTGFPEKPWA